MTKQPQWKTVANLGDKNPLEHGGLFVDVDETGVYPPEMEKVEAPPESGRSKYEIHRVVLDSCTFVNGILSDNKYHPDHPAWFAKDLGQVASFVGQSLDVLRNKLCSTDPIALAEAYRAIGDYHGWINFDQYPLHLTREEVAKRHQIND